jgi:hypothetical protein
MKLPSTLTPYRHELRDSSTRAIASGRWWTVHILSTMRAAFRVTWNKDVENLLVL